MIYLVMSFLATSALMLFFSACVTQRDPILLPIPGYSGNQSIVLNSPVMTDKAMERIPYSPNVTGGYADTMQIVHGTLSTDLHLYNYCDDNGNLLHVEMSFRLPYDRLEEFIQAYVEVLRSNDWTINENWRNEYRDGKYVVLGYKSERPLSFIMSRPRHPDDIVEVFMSISTY